MSSGSSWGRPGSCRDGAVGRPAGPRPRFFPSRGRPEAGCAPRAPLAPPAARTPRAEGREWPARPAACRPRCLRGPARPAAAAFLHRAHGGSARSRWARTGRRDGRALIATMVVAPRAGCPSPAGAIGAVHRAPSMNVCGQWRFVHAAPGFRPAPPGSGPARSRRSVGPAGPSGPRSRSIQPWPAGSSAPYPLRRGVTRCIRGSVWCRGRWPSAPWS